jgi:uncharacterized phosphosugar-binding protein
MSAGRYLDQILPLLEQLRTQATAIEAAGRVCADAIERGGVVHVFGAGHSRMMAEEAYPRIGAVAGFRPVVELAITFFHNVVGPNGLRQTLFLERVPGYGRLIFDELDARPGDAIVVFSSSGTEVIITEFVQAALDLGLSVVGVTSFGYSAHVAAERGGVERLAELATVAIDNGVPIGDALVVIDGLSERVAPSASILNLAVMDEITVATAQELVDRDCAPVVFSSPHLAGGEAAEQRMLESLAMFRKRVWGTR